MISSSSLPDPAGLVTRDLTTLEYVILSFLAIAPQSGYSILTQLESGLYRASASTGSVYPVLKRLEAAGLVNSSIEGQYETRPRKVYALYPAGERILDTWLRQAPEMADVIEQYGLMLHKFLIAEYRLSRAEVLDWLAAYERVTRGSLAMRQAIAAVSDSELLISPHLALINQALNLEVETRLVWISTAQARLHAEAVE